VALADVQTEHFDFDTNGRQSVVEKQLAAIADQRLDEVSRQLGLADLEQERILVRILYGDDELEAAMPNSAVTEWAAGIAFPAHNLILLKVDANTRSEIQDVFHHEISHIVLGRAIGGKPLPHWFVEGVAVQQAGEDLVGRWLRTAAASLRDNMMPLDLLRPGFPSDGARVHLAYAQSSAFVGYLIREKRWSGLRRLIGLIRNGASFDQAFQRVFNAPVATLETQWRNDVERTASWIPLFADTTLWWTVMTLLMIVSGLVIRQRNRLRMATMDQEVPRADDEFA
jgi:hypothetical protein